MLTCVNADRTDATLLSTLAGQRFSANALIDFLIPLGYSILKEKYAANSAKGTSLMGISLLISTEAY